MNLTDIKLLSAKDISFDKSKTEYHLVRDEEWNISFSRARQEDSSITYTLEVFKIDDMKVIKNLKHDGKVFSSMTEVEEYSFENGLMFAMEKNP